MSEVSASRTYSETMAAQLLGLSQSKLRYYRVRGMLADGVVLEPLTPPVSKRRQQRYDADLVDAGTVFRPVD